jgi:plasmid stability protein
MARSVPALTIRGLDAATRRRLRLAAANHNQSMEEEMRSILRAALDAPEAAPLSPPPVHEARPSAAASPPTRRWTSSAACASADMASAW